MNDFPTDVNETSAYISETANVSIQFASHLLISDHELKTSKKGMAVNE